MGKLEKTYDEKLGTLNSGISAVEANIDNALQEIGDIKDAYPRELEGLTEKLNTADAAVRALIGDNALDVSQVTGRVEKVEAFASDISDLNNKYTELDQLLSSPEELFGSFLEQCTAECFPENDEQGYKYHLPQLNGGFWQLVRRVSPAHNAWHPATDNLLGTDKYGMFMDDPNFNGTFSRRYNIDEVDEFLFMTGDESQWLIASKEAVNGESYDHAIREVKLSSKYRQSYTAHWHHTRYNAYDPHIALQSCNDVPSSCGDLTLDQWDAVDMLYLGNSYSGYKPPIYTGGANVFIRRKPDLPPMCTACRGMFLCHSVRARTLNGNIKMCIG